MECQSGYVKYFSQLLGLSLLAILHTEVMAAPAPITINSATFNTKSKVLVVKTTTKNTLTGSITLLHGEGGILDSRAITKTKESFSIPLAQLGQVPCSVEAQAAGNRAIKTVNGAPADCTKVPVCKIISPKPGALPYTATVGVPVNFEGKVTLKDRKAGPATIEWDFAGGVMDHPNTSKTSATFVRNDASYKVRFTAFDAIKR